MNMAVPQMCNTDLVRWFGVGVFYLDFCQNLKLNLKIHLFKTTEDEIK